MPASILLSKNLICLLFGLLLSGCGGPDSSPEQKLRDTIEQIQAAAEDRNLSDLMGHISDSYRDVRGRDKKNIRAIGQFQFVRNQNIHTFKRIKSVTLEDDQHASAIILVALAGRPIDNASALSGLRADLMGFELKFIFNQTWQIVSAHWRRAEVSDFL